MLISTTMSTTKSIETTDFEQKILVDRSCFQRRSSVVQGIVQSVLGGRSEEGERGRDEWDGRERGKEEGSRLQSDVLMVQKLCFFIESLICIWNYF